MEVQNQKKKIPSFFFPTRQISFIIASLIASIPKGLNIMQLGKLLTLTVLNFSPSSSSSQTNFLSSSSSKLLFFFLLFRSSLVTLPFYLQVAAVGKSGYCLFVVTQTGKNENFKASSCSTLFCTLTYLISVHAYRITVQVYTFIVRAWISGEKISKSQLDTAF